MEQLATTTLRTLTLEGGGPPFVAAASGLSWTRHAFYVVADDALFLAVFPTAGDAPGRRLPLFEGELPLEHAARKAKKPDLESLCLLPRGEKWLHGALLAIPSGSSPGRRRGAWLPLEPRGGVGAAARAVAFEPLFEKLAAELGTLNLEGAAQLGDSLFVANRGNTRAPSHLVELSLGRVCVALERGAPVDALAFRSATVLELGEAGGVALAPTDLCAVRGALLACAAAEDTASAYDDGRTVGAAVFQLDADLRVERAAALPRGLKPEGLWALPRGRALSLRLVCDADDPGAPSPLLEARW